MAERLDKAFLGRGWSFPVALEGGDVRLSEYEQDVREAVLIVLQTNHGERVMRPTFGANLAALAFEPLSRTTMELVRHQVEQALTEWEPRIDVSDVRVSAERSEIGRLSIEIDYAVRATNSFYNLVYPFYLLEGERA